MNVYPNLYALLESDSHARRLFEHAPSQVRRQLLTRRQAIRSVAALDAAIAAAPKHRVSTASSIASIFFMGKTILSSIFRSFFRSRSV